VSKDLSGPHRPGVGRWLWYAITGRLEPRFREWAFQDLTCRTWPVRHLARLVVLVAPVTAALIGLLPGPLSVRVTAAVMGAVIGLLYSFVFLHDSTDRRAVKLGYPSGAAQRAREARRR
jgi:membrane associated rhomboid family serine protease